MALIKKSPCVTFNRKCAYDIRTTGKDTDPDHPNVSENVHMTS